MEPAQAIRTGIATSAIAHLSILMLVLLFAEVHPFGSPAAEAVAVNIVTPEEAAEKLDQAVPPPPKPAGAFELPAAAAASTPPAPAPSEPAAQPQNPPPPRSAAKTAAAQPPPQPQPSSQPLPQLEPLSSPAPAYAAPAPDLTVKYHVMLGLPPALPLDPPAGYGDKPGAPFDGASQPADIASAVITAFRRHLRTCSKLPPSIAPLDKLKIKLRVVMTPDGKLASEPALIEASASPKGPALMQGAIEALQACQPYAMLPADRYGEWKVLDLSFTPQDFSGG